MTERLSQLLHDEATHLSAPPPDAAGILAEGRRLRRRHRVATGLAVAAGVVVAGGGLALALAIGSDDREPQPVDVDPDALVWGYGSEVHVGDVAATVPGTVLSLDHTSAGVLAVSTTGDAPLAEPGRLTLVRFDGTTEDLGELEAGQEPTTDADRDFYLLAERRGTDRDVVLRDAGTGELREQIDLPGADASRPAMWLDGDTVYLLFQDEGLHTLDLTAGRPAPAPTPGAPARFSSGEVIDGRAVTANRRTFGVVDLATGEELVSLPTASTLVDAELSPDARFLRVVRHAVGPGVAYQFEEPRTLEVYEVATGEPVEGIDIGDADAVDGGWTLSGDAYAFTETGVVRCEVPEGQCTETVLEALPDLPEPTLEDAPLARIVFPGQS